ncbi:MAG: trehalase family glycosidase [Kiritimatiellia bacterium]|nr:trehalase family glycosidase [Kiritimatiellia bacterium]MDP6810924.1 trehalase family glycosidase [Kiritimatiellia bacterium]MDP7023358.1 trehalase family glycosidase [Kiritimatiellia bacterium]
MQFDTEMSRYEGIIREWVMGKLARTCREPAGCLKYPFVDPGGGYEGNLWDWDSFWSVYGMLNLLDKDGALNGVKTVADRPWSEYAEGNIANFFDHQEKDGYIPTCILSFEEESYQIIKHREGEVLNMHKPFLAQQIALISGWKQDRRWAAQYKDGLAAYFARYEADYFNTNCGLYVWADDVMIGMDNDPATFGRPRFSTANLFLNSFMVAELRAGASLFADWGDASLAATLQERERKLSEAIREECWDRRDQIFYSVDVDVKTRPYHWYHKGLGVFWKTLPIKIRAWSSFLPLWAGVASAEEAAVLADVHARDETTFLAPYGICSLAMDERMFDLRATNNPSNWLGPIWLVVQYCVFRGLMRYGYRDQAADLCVRALRLLGEDLKRTGTLHEYYDPQSGEPVMTEDFVNWNVLVLNMVDELRGGASMGDLIDPMV